jgi:hypothetical protein
LSNDYIRSTQQGLPLEAIVIVRLSFEEKGHETLNVKFKLSFTPGVAIMMLTVLFAHCETLGLDDIDVALDSVAGWADFMQRHRAGVTADV